MHRWHCPHCERGQEPELSAGVLVEIKVTPEGESVEHIEDRRVNGTINTNATALGAAALADDVEILDTTSEGVLGRFVPAAYRG